MLTRDELADAFARHSGYVLRYCYSRLGHIQQAEDVAGQAWLHAVERASQYEDRGVGVLPWLRSIARSRCWDYQRRARLIRMLPLVDMHAAPVGSRDAWVDTLALVHGAGLTDAQRAVLVARAQGYKLHEIAEAGDMNLSAVKGLETRARARLARARAQEAVQ